MEGLSPHPQPKLMSITPARIRVTLAALWVAGASLALAQNRNSLQLQFITFPSTSDPIELELIVSRTETKKIEIASNELSQPVLVPRLGTLIFGETLVDADNKPSFKEYGRGKPVAARKQIILILRRGKELADGFEVRAVPGDSTGFGGGRLLFLNAADLPIAGTAGGKPFALAPGRHAIIKPKPDRDGRLAFVEFAYRLNGEVKAKPFYSSFWPVSDYTRGMVFFLRDPVHANKITFHTVREFLTDEP